MKKILTTVICSLVGINTMLMADQARPRLVVGIVVDQLRTDYIEYLRRHFGERGFNLLMKQGAYLRDVDFPATGIDAVAATAIAMTGAILPATESQVLKPTTARHGRPIRHFSTPRLQGQALWPIRRRISCFPR